MLALATVLAGTVALIGTPLPSASVQTPAGYSQAVTQICAGALLFEGRHRIGTRAGAIAVSRDIRATGERRLRRVDAVAKPTSTAELAARWIAVERELVQTYASTYLEIWNAIENARSPAEHRSLPALLRTLLGRPERLQGQAASLAQRLYVPDCTGGEPSRMYINQPDQPDVSPLPPG
jgi:hypothetical protein